MASDSEKSVRVGYLCTTIVMLGLMVFLAKMDACTLACNSCATDGCNDAFFETDKYPEIECRRGAVAEVVSSPPAPKAGILCHCPQVKGKVSSSPTAPPANLQIDAAP